MKPLLLLISLLIGLANCKTGTKNTVRAGTDTLALLQAVLDYPEIKNDYMYFKGQNLKMVQSKVVRPYYKLLYRNKPVEIVHLKEEGRDIGITYPKQFYVGAPSMRLFSKDSAQVVYLRYAGSSTSVFTLKKDDCSWKISTVVYGKY